MLVVMFEIVRYKDPVIAVRLTSRRVSSECNVVYGRQDIGEGWAVAEMSQSWFQYVPRISARQNGYKTRFACLYKSKRMILESPLVR